VKHIRGPQIKTARNMFALPILQPESEAWFAQNLDDFLAEYDWTVPMAMPLMESVPADESDAWLTRLVNAVAARPARSIKPFSSCRPGTGTRNRSAPFR
jgi:biofilm PGA synthesis lipoprotein PgaB